MKTWKFKKNPRRKYMGKSENSNTRCYVNTGDKLTN